MVKAHYVAAREEIAARYAEWKIIGRPEIRDVETHAQYCHPYRAIEHAEFKRLQEPPPHINVHLEQPPAIDCLARYLVALFLPVRDVLRAPSALRADAECGGAASRNQGPNAP